MLQIEGITPAEAQRGKVAWPTWGIKRVLQEWKRTWGVIGRSYWREKSKRASISSLVLGLVNHGGES